MTWGRIIMQARSLHLARNCPPKSCPAPICVCGGSQQISIKMFKTVFIRIGGRKHILIYEYTHKLICILNFVRLYICIWGQ